MAASKAGSSVVRDMETPARLGNLQDTLLKTPLPLDITVETVQQLSDTEDDTDSRLSSENLYHIQGNISRDLGADLNTTLNETSTGKTHVMLVVDRSGSMSGNPMNQVKTALTEIVRQCLSDSNKILDIILYGERARTLSFTQQTYHDVIQSISAGGTTSFKAAFDETQDVMRKRKEQQLTETVIMFMTDGKDTVTPQSRLNEFVKKWARALKDSGQNVTAHAVGFSRDHDLEFLTRISKAGAQPGMYRYCEPGDGPQALKDKLEELFDYVNISEGRPIQFQISLANKDDKLVIQGSGSGTVDGKIQSIQIQEGHTELIASCECWIYISDPSTLPQMSIGISLNIKKKNIKCTLQIPCTTGNIKHKVITEPSDKALWDLAVLSRNIDILTSQLVDAITTSGDVMRLKKRLDHLQSKISNTEIFGAGFDKETRAQIMNYVKDMQGKMDTLHTMLAQYLRGEAHSVSLLARAQDLRYDAQFSKSRRQRLMDRRVAQNYNVVTAKAQESRVANEEELACLTEKSLEFFYCILSLNTVKDILMDPTDLENAIGIGLAVARPEHVLDNPTSIRIFSISGSLVSRSSVMDALQFKINLENHLSAHGGFSFVNMQDSDLPFATVGAGREPINAWLPLYICPAHWQRVKSCLRPSLGYLCTLDPLGYSDSQLDILFMVLGCMMGQLWEGEVGENQLKLIFCLQRTCQACIEEFNLERQISEAVQNFLTTPNGRFRHVMPNLFTLIGYMASLPLSVTKHLLSNCSDDKCTETKQLSKLWLAFLTETLRRASASKPEFHKTENLTTGLLNLLLHGRAGQDNHTPVCTSGTDIETAHHFGHLSYNIFTGHQLDSQLNIPEYDPNQGLEPREIHVQQSVKVDKAMEIWAQAHCGVIKNKNRSDQVAGAKKVVKKWVKMVKEKAGLTSEGKFKSIMEALQLDPGKAVEVPPCKTVSEGGSAASAGIPENSAANPAKEAAQKIASSYDTRAVNSSILEVASKLLSQLSRACYPPLSSLPGCIGFLHNCISAELNLKDMDMDGGLPPQSWIDGAKQVVQQFFNKMSDFSQLCDASATVETSNSGDGGDGDDDDVNGHGPRAAGNNPDQKNTAEDDDADLYDSFDEDEPVSQFLRENRRTHRQRIVTIPMLISALDIPGDHVELIRAMLCQAVSYPSNSQAREAATSGELIDLTLTGLAERYLRSVEVNIIERKEAAQKKQAEKAAWEIGNLCMLRAESIWAFIGYLLMTYKERGEGFSALIHFILECPGAKGFPHLAEKLKILLMGKYQDVVVFAKGNSWIPDKKLSASFEALLGEEVWQDIETELLSNVHVHVYRESDIPNRHGHCNSNPYIPNRIRQILGMPLIDEKIQPRTSTRRHKSLQRKK